MTDVEAINIERTRNFIMKSVREGMKGITFSDEASRQRMRDGIVEVTRGIVRHIVEERAKEIDIHADVTDSGQLVVTLSGPKDLLGGFFPGRTPGTKRLVVVGGDIADSRCLLLKARRGVPRSPHAARLKAAKRLQVPKSEAE